MIVIFPELMDKQDHIQKIVRGEEEAFNATLDRGLEIFDQVVQQIGHSKTFPGEDAFKLYDTYGFPLDLTELLATERGLKVDVAVFTELMEKQRDRSRVSGTSASITLAESPDSERFDLPGRDILQRFAKDIAENRLKFVGYDQLDVEATIVKGDRHLLVLDATPFYGEAGGQVGDQGALTIAQRTFNVHDTQKVGNLNVHILKEAAPTIVGEKIRAQVDAVRRRSIMRNHSATHLLHAALRKMLGTHVHQAGSLVAPDYLRFDFAHFSKVSDAELTAIEDVVNQKIQEDIKLHHYRDIHFDDAKKMGALMFFGDKYGDRVNVVEFGDYSREFCGGTHVLSTGDIGYFKFRSEGSVASGVRRIEAVTAEYALELMKLQDRNAAERLEYAVGQLQELVDLSNQIKVHNGSLPLELESSLAQFTTQIGLLQRAPTSPKSFSENLRGHFHERSERGLSLESFILGIAEKRKLVDRELSKYRLQSQSGSIDGYVHGAQLVQDVKVVSIQVEAYSLDELKLLGDSLRTKLGRGVGVLAAIIDGKVSLVCVVTDDLAGSRKLEAGKIVGSVAKLLGGGGGGKAHLATAGAKDISKLPEALAAAPSIVQSMLKSS
jgi:alanyl-tRNA synthetase